MHAQRSLLRTAGPRAWAATVTRSWAQSAHLHVVSPAASVPGTGTVARAAQQHVRSTHTSEAQPQLFGVPYLRSPGDFKKAAAVAMSVCEPLVAEVANGQGQHGLRTLHKLDIISDTICKVLDAAECTRNIHSSDEWRVAADETFQALAAYMYSLNANVPLYQALRQLTDDAECMSKLTEEQRRMGILLRREFERDGIHLNDGLREQVVGLNNEIGALASDFMAKVHAAPIKVTVPHAGPVQACLPPHMLAGLPARSFADKVAGPSAPMSITSHPLVVEYILRLCRDAAVRESTLLGAHADHAGAVDTLGKLVHARARLAKIIGFDSYASLVASDRMAGDPARVITFLRHLSKALLPRLAAELAALSKAAAVEAEAGSARKAEPMPAGGALPDDPLRALYALITSGVGGHVGLADLPYLSRAVTASRYWGLPPGGVQPSKGLAGTGKAVHTSPAPDPLSADTAAASEYLSLSCALEGLALVMRHVYGVSMVRLPLSTGEGWDAAGEGKAGKGALVKLVLRHDAEGALGTLYLDPFARKGKFGGAAHFVVRCGKRLHEGDGQFEAAMGVDTTTQFVSATPGSAAGPAQRFQLPIITLVTSMAPVTGEGRPIAEIIAKGKDPLPQVLLTPGELETLFHEFGHALHSLLSRTEFQHLSGTRGALDFVEMPSHVMEYFARDLRVVKAFAKHHVTGAPMPEDLWSRVQAARSDFTAHEIASSLANASFDLALHGGQEGGLREVLQGPPVTLQEVQAIAEAAVAAARAAPVGGAIDPLTLVPPAYLTPSLLAIPLAPSDTLGPLPQAPASEQAGSTTVPEPAPADSTRLYHSVCGKYTLPTLPGTASQAAPYAWHARFSHLASYGAGYYTYLYATAFAAAVWDSLFAADPFSRSAGEAYRRAVLSRGAAGDPCAMLTQLLGAPPTLEPLLRELKLLPPKAVQAHAASPGAEPCSRTEAIKSQAKA